MFGARKRFVDDLSFVSYEQFLSFEITKNNFKLKKRLQIYSRLDKSLRILLNISQNIEIHA
jgi:hypothetical protein